MSECVGIVGVASTGNVGIGLMLLAVAVLEVVLGVWTFRRIIPTQAMTVAERRTLVSTTVISRGLLAVVFSYMGVFAITGRAPMRLRGPLPIVAAVLIVASGITRSAVYRRVAKRNRAAKETALLD